MAKSIVKHALEILFLSLFGSALVLEYQTDGFAESAGTSTLGVAVLLAQAMILLAGARLDRDWFMRRRPYAIALTLLQALAPGGVEGMFVWSLSVAFVAIAARDLFARGARPLSLAHGAALGVGLALSATAGQLAYTLAARHGGRLVRWLGGHVMPASWANSPEPVLWIGAIVVAGLLLAGVADKRRRPLSLSTACALLALVFAGMLNQPLGCIMTIDAGVFFVVVRLWLTERETRRPDGIPVRRSPFDWAAAAVVVLYYPLLYPLTWRLDPLGLFGHVPQENDLLLLTAILDAGLFASLFLGWLQARLSPRIRSLGGRAVFYFVLMTSYYRLYLAAAFLFEHVE